MATILDFSASHLAGSQGLGAFGLKVEEDGGLVAEADLRVGFGRRNVEAISLQLPLSQALNYSDRIDFLAAPAFNFGLSMAFEELLQLEAPERAHFIRVILLEINRISSHLHFFAKIAKAVGHQPVMNHCLREREKFCDILEMYCGSRLGFGAICLGGVIEDATDGWFFRIEKAISSLKAFLPDLDRLLLSHPFFEERAKGLASISNEMASLWNITGPNARASGREGDIRASKPYSGYSYVPFSLTSSNSVQGDVFSRCQVRVEEMLQSASYIESAFRRIPAGNHRIRVGMEVSPAPGKAVCNVEGPRGRITILAESEGGSRPANIRFFCPSAMVVQILPNLLRGIHVEDVFLAVHSLDISFSEVDK